MNIESKWYILTVPMKKEEYFCNQIKEEIKKLALTKVGPCIIPSNTFLKNIEGEIKEHTLKLFGFIFIKTNVIKDEKGNLVPDPELSKLLNNFPKLNIIFKEPLSDKELETMLNTNESIENQQNRVLSGIAEDCIINKINSQISDDIYDVEILTFGRKVNIYLTSKEIGK